MPFQKGHEKRGGRKPGTQNKVNTPYRQVLDAFAENTLNEEELTRLYNSISDSEKAVFAPKILPYLTPKKSEVELSGSLSDEMIDAMINRIADKHEAGSE